jgi:hypothetical protein
LKRDSPTFPQTGAILTFKRSAVVLIGVDRGGVGRDNSS